MNTTSSTDSDTTTTGEPHILPDSTEGIQINIEDVKFMEGIRNACKVVDLYRSDSTQHLEVKCHPQVESQRRDVSKEMNVKLVEQLASHFSRDCENTFCTMNCTVTKSRIPNTVQEIGPVVCSNVDVQACNENNDKSQRNQIKNWCGSSFSLHIHTVDSCVFDETSGASYTWVQTFSQYWDLKSRVRLIHGGVLSMGKYGTLYYISVLLCKAFFHHTVLECCDVKSTFHVLLFYFHFFVYK